MSSPSKIYQLNCQYNNKTSHRNGMFPPKKFLIFFFARHPFTCLSHSPPKSPPLALLADKCKTLTQVTQVHAQMILTSRIRDHFASSRLLSFYALSNSGNLSYALKLFKSTPDPNLFMWNTLLRALANGPSPNKALTFYIDMRRQGLAPNNHTFPFLLKASRSIRICKQAHTHVLKSGLDLDLHVVKSLMRCYSVSNALSDVRRLFDELPERDLSILTIMISGYAQNFCSDEALVMFDRMVAEGFEPNGATFALVLSACARTGCLDLGERIHNYMKEKRVEIGVILGTALVHMYAKNGEILKARTLFDSMNERNVATWNAVICGLASHGHAEEALSLFRRLEREGVLPNDITFVGVLSACCHAGFDKVGHEIFGSMKEVYGIEPKIEHYGCMVDLLGRVGKLEEAEKLMKGMAWKPDVVMLGALLSACKNDGNIEIAERIANDVLALDPQNHMVYVVLSNMYAEAERWGDVARLRKVMKTRKLKKNPGWSLVDDDC